MSAILHQALMAAYPVAGGGGGGPAWSNVRSLMKFEGANNSSTFTDSTGLRSWSGVGSPVISTAQSRFGGSSLSVGGRYVQTADSADIEPGAQDFCVECFFRASATTGGIFCKSPSSGFASFQVSLNGSTNLIVDIASTAGWYKNGVSYSTGSAWALNTWYHVALCRKGNNGGLFFNGNRINGDWSGFFTGITLRDNTGPLAVGIGLANSRGGMSGFIDEFRYVVGESVYDPANATITVPTEEFPTS